MKTYSGFTLIELMVVVVIVGILAAIAVPTFTNTKEKTLDREAIAALQLMKAANKLYYARNEFYFPSSGTVTALTSINGNLSLALNDSNWQYSVQWITSTNFRVNASRVGGARSWSAQAATDPTCSGTCL